MTPRIVILKEKKLIGKSLTMSLTNNRTGELWGSFAPRIKEIKNNSTTDKNSMQVYDDKYFKNLDPHKEFTFWAALEVTDFSTIPLGLESLAYMLALTTKALVMTAVFSNTSMALGCPVRDTSWTKGHILKY